MQNFDRSGTLSVLKRLRGIQFSIKKPSLIPSFAWHYTAKHSAQMCTTITYLDELKLQKHLNACLRQVVTRTLERFLNLTCPAVSDLLRFRFFIQLRSQRAARVM